MLHASGVSDVRSILVVRQAFQLTAERSHSLTDGFRDSEFANDLMNAEDLGMSDEEDDGGSGGLPTATGKSKMLMRRSFELLLKTGSVIRFEVSFATFTHNSTNFVQAHSKKTAQEWINGLRAIIMYYGLKQRHDAAEEMELAEAGNKRPALTPRPHHEIDCPPEPPPFAEGSSANLSSIYDWCVLDACRAVLKSGRLYTRNKRRQGPYS